jgi:hypothetical protein
VAKSAKDRIAEVRGLEAKIAEMQQELIKKASQLKMDMLNGVVQERELRFPICDGGCIAISPIPPCSGCCIRKSPAT